jgi:hypothetical protein
MLSVCDGYETELVGCKFSRQVLTELKIRKSGKGIIVRPTVINLFDIRHRIGNCKNSRSITYNGAIHKFIQSGEGGGCYDTFL